MTEITLAIVDRQTGTMVVDTESDAVARAAASEFGDGAPMGCANPVHVLHPDRSVEQPEPHVRINGFWHDSFVEGPGRRSVVRFQGCPIRCAGCWVPQTHDPDGGYDVNVGWLADALLDPAYQRDGVTILGGEPFAQSVPLWLLVLNLRDRNPSLNIVVYSGYTLEALNLRNDSATWGVLNMINMLIDGRYFNNRMHSKTCGCDDGIRLWTGSCNQRIHRLK